jgi:ABC-type sugar transport system ATPase subunit
LVDALRSAKEARSLDYNGYRGAMLTIREVSQSFELHGQPLPVLDSISLHLERGEFVALLGPSGCGKSTLLRLVAGLTTPSAGRLLVDDREIEGPDPTRVVVFQDPTLYPWRTVRSNVALGLEARGLLRTHAGLLGSTMPIRTNFRAGWRNVPLWRARWSTIQSCSSLTNHWASWIP